MLIDRISTFRGSIVEHTVNKSSGGFAQWQAQLLAAEIYDEDEKAWVDFSDYDAREITTFLVLFDSKEQATLNCHQVKKITNWDGLSFFDPDCGLSNLDLSKVGIQWRVEENTYNDKTSLQVSWVDEYDAAPGRTVRKLNPDDMRALDAQYASILKNTGKKAAPAKAKPGKVTAKGAKSTQPKGPVTKKGAVDPLGPQAPKAPATGAAIAPTAPTAPAAPKAPDTPELPAGTCTKNEAWEAVYELKAKEVTDEKIATVWTESVQKVAPGVEQEDISEEQWYSVRELVLEATAVF